MYDVIIREVGEQTFLTERRHLLVAGLPAWIGSTLDRLEAVARECGGIAGSPFVRYYAEVSDESDGPAEACVPVADPPPPSAMPPPTAAPLPSAMNPPTARPTPVSSRRRSPIRRSTPPSTRSSAGPPTRA